MVVWESHWFHGGSFGEGSLFGAGIAQTNHSTMRKRGGRFQKRSQGRTLNAGGALCVVVFVCVSIIHAVFASRDIFPDGLVISFFREALCKFV